MQDTNVHKNDGPIINLVDDDTAKNITWQVDDGIDEIEEVKELLKEGFEKENNPVEKVDTPLNEDDEEIHTEQENRDETSDNSEDQKEDDETKKREHKVPRKKRINELVRDKKRYIALAEDTILQKKQLEHENELLRQELLRKEKERLDSYELTIDANIDNVKRSLMTAKEEGDYKTETEATDLLSKFNVRKMQLMKDKENLSNYSNNYQNQQQQHNQHQQPDQFDEVQSTYNENAMNWLKSNSWADPKSTNFDRDLHEEAADYEKRLAKAYRLEGKGDEVGSEDFWNEITDHVREEFDLPPPRKQTTRQDKLIMAGTNSPVSSVSRQNMNPNAPAKNKPLPLTALEKQFAHKLYGKIREPNGKLITDLRKCEEYYMKNR